jgi:hypothetical protein
METGQQLMSNPVQIPATSIAPDIYANHDTYFREHVKATAQELRHCFARSARARVEAEHSIQMCSARWQELLRELVDSCESREPLRIPRRLHLPPVHPGLCGHQNGGGNY